MGHILKHVTRHHAIYTAGKNEEATFDSYIREKTYPHSDLD